MMYNQKVHKKYEEVSRCGVPNMWLRHAYADYTSWSSMHNLRRRFHNSQKKDFPENRVRIVTLKSMVKLAL